MVDRCLVKVVDNDFMREVDSNVPSLFELYLFSQIGISMERDTRYDCIDSILLINNCDCKKDK